MGGLTASLRLAQRGWKTLWTPHAVLRHAESSTLGYVHDEPTRATIARETEAFRRRWGALVERDPYYNVNLTQRGTPFSLAFPPRNLEELRHSSTV